MGGLRAPLQRTVNPILVVFRGPLTRVPLPRHPVRFSETTTSRGHDQCAEGRTASLRPSHLYLRIVIFTDIFKPVHQLGRRNTQVSFDLLGVPTRLGDLATSKGWMLVRIGECVRTGRLAAAGFPRCRCLFLASDRSIDNLACGRGRLFRFVPDAGLDAMAQLHLRSKVLYWGCQHIETIKKNQDFARLTSVTFEVGGSVGHLHKFSSPRASPRMQAKELTVCWNRPQSRRYRHQREVDTSIYPNSRQDGLSNRCCRRQSGRPS
jgi:hypothetical protein